MPAAQNLVQLGSISQLAIFLVRFSNKHPGWLSTISRNLGLVVTAEVMLSWAKCSHLEINVLVFSLPVLDVTCLGEHTFVLAGLDALAAGCSLFKHLGFGDKKSLLWLVPILTFLGVDVFFVLAIFSSKLMVLAASSSLLPIFQVYLLAPVR